MKTTKSEVKLILLVVCIGITILFGFYSIDGGIIGKEKVFSLVPEVDISEMSTYTYRIDEIDIDLRIPDTMFVYRIDGVYEDWNGKLGIHDFCEWILITDQEYDEHDLAHQIKDNFADIVEHVVYGLALTSKDLQPLSFLYSGIWGVGQSRITKDGYCCIFSPSYSQVKYDDEIGAAIYSAYEKRREEWEPLRRGWSECIVNSTLPMTDFWITTVTTLRPSAEAYWGGEDPFACTIVNDNLWKVYLWAVDELTADPESYEYTKDEIELLLDGAMERQCQRDGHTFTVANAYADSSADISIRAYYYALYTVDRLKRKNVNDEEFLRQFTVLFYSWQDGQESFDCYLKGGGGEYSLIDSSCNYFQNLQRCRDYIENHNEAKEDAE